jgi:hypothetical protein
MFALRMNELVIIFLLALRNRRNKKISLPHEISIEDTTASARAVIMNREYLLDIKQI